MGFFTKLKEKIATSVAAKVAAGAAIVALLGCGTVGFAFAGGLVAPKTVVGVALLNTFVSGNKELFEDVKEQGGEFFVEVSGQELALDTFGIGGGMFLPNTTFRLNAKSNPEQEINATLELLVSGNSLLLANAYVNKEQWQVTVPKLFSAVLTGKHYAEEATEEFLESEQSKELLQSLASAYEEYLADAEVKKGKKEELRINGVRHSCRVYQVNLPAENLNGFLQEVSQEAKAYQAEPVALPVFTDAIKLTFHICRERVVSLNVQWTTETEGGSLQLIPSANGEFTMDVTADSKTWNVKGSLTAAQNEIAALAGKQLDVLNMTEAEETALKAEMSRNITWMMFKYMGLLK